MNYIFIFLLLFVAELAYFRLANYFDIIDKPNQRSSHTRITLRGGGVVCEGVALNDVEEARPSVEGILDLNAQGEVEIMYG